ncbi:2-oxoacid:ferredoxin oxidoreductase subunit beta [Anaeromyxobacter oryzisoli]|jgi:2-oxoglutarate/2-oxoacid ferredoxin oxidoreductase subunit beta|uniref:2-oxoacid:ferredoxin oxidoreductase subunit beta n=1 Tax=Anaeromyxobacter oryzisoli TaxID=2925408 RepID=UPI001F578908|nr:2-oxoacid:ferredoxin oxidoreductase subunit beta [Anaeromyxobacter sp. SG63]
MSAPVKENPVNKYLRTERMPSIWCPGCGIGTTVNCFTRALDASGFDLDKVAIVSGIGCTGRVAGYLKLDSFHTTHGRAIPFATGLQLANPDLKVVVYSGDGDLTAIGGNHLVHAARRNADMLVVCVNNFTYGMTGGQVTPTTFRPAIASTTPYGAYEETFNLPRLADSCGAVYVARWTAYHVRQLAKSMGEALNKKGFRFIEIIAPCPTLYLRRNKLGDGLDEMKFYREKSVIKHGADTREVNLDFRQEITVGKFVDRERPTLEEAMEKQMTKTLGSKYVPYQSPGKKPAWS